MQIKYNKNANNPPLIEDLVNELLKDDSEKEIYKIKFNMILYVTIFRNIIFYIFDVIFF